MTTQQLNDLLSQWGELEPKVIFPSELSSLWKYIEPFEGEELEFDPHDARQIPYLPFFLQNHITQSGHSLKILSYSQNRHSVFIGDAVSEQNRDSLLEALLMGWIRFLKWERR